MRIKIEGFFQQLDDLVIIHDSNSLWVMFDIESPKNIDA